MRTLYYIPIIHTSADMGSLSQALTERGTRQVGRTAWSEHLATVQVFWDAVHQYVAGLPAAGMKVYQDGMVADGEMGAKIVAAGAQAGSRNHQIVEMLRQRGADLVKTEDLDLVLEERNRLLAAVQAPTLRAKLMALLKYRFFKGRLLKRRDQFMAGRIAQTLPDGATGILFVGAYHRVRPQLPIDIQVIEVKEARRVRQYQALLPLARWRSRRFASLRRYLEAPIPFSTAAGKAE